MMEQIVLYTEVVLTVLGGLVIAATGLSRVVHKMKPVLGKVYPVLDKLFSLMPTIGLNPSTKELKEAIEEAKR